MACPAFGAPGTATRHMNSYRLREATLVAYTPATLEFFPQHLFILCNVSLP